ncbi:MAG TPA: hypothetical protein VG738_24280 [Chitinophagaceae bacterium]|nr:hypothetical protein [Chitinophagaceae bacterium]
MKKIITIALSAVIAVTMSATSVHANAATVNASVKSATSTEVHDKNGKLLYSVKRYDESQLSREVKSIIHSQYADFDIAGVEEIVVPGMEKSIYIIHLQNETSLKTVKVYDGEIEVTGNYKRG